MRHGKDYMSDKPGFTTLEQLAAVRQVQQETGRIYSIDYSERLETRASVKASELVHSGAIGRVIQTTGLGPHRPRLSQRPWWFFERNKYGGILCDIASHQCDQYLYYTGETEVEIVHAQVANYAHPQHPEFEDFGDMVMRGKESTGYIRVDWFTPDGLSTWGDGRTVILGTKGYIELRKYLDVARDKAGDQVYLVDHAGERHLSVAGQVGFRFFGELILDCLRRTDKAMTQAHVFKAAELCLRAQLAARRIA
jgi:predicted dehydrogenase